MVSKRNDNVSKHGKAKTESEANKIFEIQKDELRDKYGDFPDGDVQCIWCIDYSTAG